MRNQAGRAGSMQLAWLAFLGSILAFAVLVTLLAWDRQTERAARSLLVYCASGIRTPVEAAARAYEAEFGVQIQVQFGPSETLLTNVTLGKQGDLFLPADESYTRMAHKRDLIAEVLPLASMTPVIAVAPGNPKEIRGLRELLNPSVRVALADPDAAAIGKLTRDALLPGGQWDQLKSRTLVFKTTVTDVANDIKLGTVDAGILWDALVKQLKLEEVATPELLGIKAQVPVAVLRSSTQPTAALHFARYLAARDRGLEFFANSGFHVVEGDPWASRPEINLLSGAMLRPAIEKTLIDFEAREGCRVNRVYNGCGLLVAQMKAGERPDMYFACDQSFMAEVTDLFLDAVDISTNQLVILVPKGNPHGVKSLHDLGKPGLKLGVGHEKNCALGVITQKTLEEAKFKDPVMKNVKVQLPTGDGLVNHLRTKALDAVIAYVSNAAGFGDELDAIVVDVPCATAVQPIAVGKQSKFPHLSGRLLAALRSQQSRVRFEQNGFHWQEKK